MLDIFAERKRARQQRTYENLCDTLRDAGVDTPEKAEKCRKGILKNGLNFTLMVSMLGAGAAILLSNWQEQLLVFTLILLLLIWSGVYRSWKLVGKFSEELSTTPVALPETTTSEPSNTP